MHGMRLLEFGCGPGWTTIKLANALPSSRITCVEKSARFVVLARAKLKAAGLTPRTSIVHADANATGLDDGSFDFVTFRFVLQHLRQVCRMPILCVHSSTSPPGLRFINNMRCIEG
ncbi:MAG: hypothetical protein SGPRY_003125 [Prymnesium sp.]